MKRPGGGGGGGGRRCSAKTRKVLHNVRFCPVKKVYVYGMGLKQSTRQQIHGYIHYRFHILYCHLAIVLGVASHQ